MNNEFKMKFNSPHAVRYGFTLIELLLVVAIIAVMSSMAIGVMRQAQNDAKESATQSRITQIEAMLEIVMEDYDVRRMPVDLYSIATSRKDAKEKRYQIIAELIDVEMPRDNSTPIGEYRPGSLLATATAPKSAAMERWTNRQRNGFDLPGEYLYEILNAIDIDGTPGIEMLGSQAVGFSDPDTIPEVVDAWGEPLNFMIQQRVADTGVDEDDFIEFDPSLQPATKDIRIVVTSSRLNN